MEETVYGIQVVRTLICNLAREPGTIQLWKSWPDGARCLMLELLAEEVPERRKAWPEGVMPWRRLHFENGPRCTFDPDRDWWVAPSDVDELVLWTSSRETPVLMRVTPRRR